MTQSNELLPCPFCGETTDNGFLAHKGSCYIMQKAVGANPETLKDAWNTRATPPQSPNRAVLDALQKLDQMRLRAYSHANISNSPKDMKEWIDRDYAFIRDAIAAATQADPSTYPYDRSKYVTVTPMIKVDGGYMKYQADEVKFIEGLEHSLNILGHEYNSTWLPVIEAAHEHLKRQKGR